MWMWGLKCQILFYNRHQGEYSPTIAVVVATDKDAAKEAKTAELEGYGARRATYYACHRVRYARECHWGGVYHRDEPWATDGGGNGITFWPKIVKDCRRLV
jgi:hypothetical protein